MRALRFLMLVAAAGTTFAAPPLACDAGAAAQEREPAANPTPQSPPLLLVERGEDRAGRDRLLQRLRRTPMDVHLRGTTVRELARLLSTAVRDEVSFLVTTQEEEEKALPKLDLELRKAPLTSLLAVVRDTTDLRFVYRDGLVLIRRKDEVREHKSLRLYDLRMATARVPDFPAPRVGLGLPGEESAGSGPPSEESGTTVSGWTMEQLVELVRTHVAPETWGDEGVSITEGNGILMVRQADHVHESITRLLAQLGAGPIAGRLVEPTRKAGVGSGSGSGSGTGVDAKRAQSPARAEAPARARSDVPARARADVPTRGSAGARR